MAEGHGEDETVAIEATVVPPEQVKQVLGSDLGSGYTVLDVTITPRGKTYDIHPDDFILRSDSTGDHSGPLLAGQVAGDGELVVERNYAGKANAESAPILSGMKVEMRDGKGDSALLAAVKKRILTDRTAEGPVSGWMFFPLDKAKPRSLALSCTTPAGKLRIQFR